jgi:hypothetical protein
MACLSYPVLFPTPITCLSFLLNSPTLPLSDYSFRARHTSSRLHCTTSTTELNWTSSSVLWLLQGPADPVARCRQRFEVFVDLLRVLWAVWRRNVSDERWGQVVCEYVWIEWWNSSFHYSRWYHVSGVPWPIITGSGLDLLTFKYLHSSGLHAIQRCRYSIHFQFTVAHALGLLVFTSRILATDLSRTHWHLNSHMTSSWHSLIPFLPFSAAANFEDSTQFSSDYCSVLLQLLNSQFQFSNLISLVTNRLSLYSLGSDTIENTVFSCQILLCYLATRCSMVHNAAPIVACSLERVYWVVA